MRKLTLSGLAALGMLAFAPLPGQALVMDFNSLPIGSPLQSGAFINQFTPYTEQGLTATPSGSTATPHFDIGYFPGIGGSFGNNIGDIHKGNGGERVSFTYNGGALFNLQSIDITGWIFQSPDTSLTVTFAASSGATLDVILNSIGTIDFTVLAGWSAISSFYFSVPLTPDLVCSPTGGNGCTEVGFDNIVFEAANLNAVPIPGALPLFASALGALGLIGWRRKRKAGKITFATKFPRHTRTSLR